MSRKLHTCGLVLLVLAFAVCAALPQAAAAGNETSGEAVSGLLATESAEQGLTFSCDSGVYMQDKLVLIGSDHIRSSALFLTIRQGLPEQGDLRCGGGC